MWGYLNTRMRPAVPELSAAYSASYPHNCFAHENMKFAAFPGAPLDLNPVVDPSSPGLRFALSL